MSSKSPSNRSSATGTRTREANGRFSSRGHRRSRSSAGIAGSPVDQLAETQQDSSRPPGSGREVEQIVILSLALVFGLVGLAIHILWLASIVLMAILLGLAAAAVRRRAGRGAIGEVVAQAKTVVAEISGSDTPEDSHPRSAGAA